jgi:NAD(P)-dependent dehydrogenase (short-subunit alcohol dehydrogenase family)
MGLVGDSAIVTGGMRGIGLGITRTLLERGASVVIFDLDGDGVAEAVSGLESEFGAGKAAGYAGSVTSSEDWVAAFDLAEDRFGTVRILANNAGWASMALVVDLDEGDWDQCFDVCAKGTFLGTREFARRIGDAGGAVVNTSSINAWAATDGIAHYCAAKAAVSQFTKVAAAELAPRGVRVNAVAPGITRTPMSEGGFLAGRMGEEFLAHTPMGRFGEPEDIARAVAFLASNDGGWVTGVTLPVDGGGHIRGLQNYWATMNEETPA